MDRYIQELSTLKEDLSKQIDEIEVSHSKRSDKFSKDIRDLFSKHIRMLDSICDLKYNDSIKRECDGAALRKGILKAIEEIRNIEVMEGLMRIIDEYDQGWMSSFRETYPNFTDREYLLAMYLYVGFRTETMVVLLGTSSPQAVHVLKYRLKMKMLKVGDESTDRFLKALNISR